MKSLKVIGGGGLKLHVEDGGNPHGKTILFIHGFSQCHLVWRKQIHSRLARDFRLVTMDIRGHGLSEKPCGVYGDSKLWADDVREVIVTLGLKNPLLVGWSYGGAIISDYIASYGEADIAGTNWVAAISRVGAPLRQGAFLGPDFLSVVPGLLSQNAQRSLESMQAFVRLCKHTEISPEELILTLAHGLSVPLDVRIGLLSRELNNDEVISKMRKPMLLSYGDYDAVVSLSMAKHIMSLVKHAKLSVYHGIGHSPFWEASRRFNRELRELRNTT